MFERIIGFILLRKTLSAGTSLVESLLVGMAVVLLLGLIASILLASLIGGGIYVSYHAMLSYGITPFLASCIIGGTLFMLLLLIMLTIIMCVLRIKTIPRRLITVESKFTEPFNKVVDAFINGLNNTPVRR